MSLEAGNIVFDIKGDDTALKKTLKNVEKEFSRTSKAIGAAMTVAGAAITGAVAGIGYESLHASAEINKAALRMVASLGLPAAEAERFREMIRKVYGDNFGSSLADVGEAIQVVALSLKRVGVTSSEGITKATEDAITLRDTYQTGVSESVNAAAGLMQNFGMTSDQAFDFITLGMQRGLNASGDFLDSIGEYSTQFAEGGADAAQFFSMMEGGMQSGMLGTDKAADAFKEFRVRLLDGTKSTADALSALGLNVGDIAKKINDGTMTMADAWVLVTEKLKGTKDEAVQFQAGVALIGTQFEDLGAKTIFNMDMMKTSMADMNGATQGLSIQYETLGNTIEAFRRKVILAGEALVNSIAPALNDLMGHIAPLVDRFTAWARENEEIASTLVMVAAVIGAVMLVVGPLLLLLPGIGVALGGITAMSWPMIVAVVAIGAALVGLAYYVYESMAAWDGWEGLWEWVKGLFESARTWFEDNFAQLKQIFDNAMKGILIVGGMLWEGLQLGFNLLWEVLSRVFGEIGEGWMDVAGVATDGTATWLDVIQEMQEKTIRILTEVSKAFERFTDFIYWIWPVIAAAIEIGANLFIEPFFAMLDRLYWIADQVAGIMAGLGSAWDWLFGGGGMAGNVNISGPQGMATGGVVERGGWAMVGERGPELVQLPRGATVYDSAQTRAAGGQGGGSTFNMTFNISGATDPGAISRGIADQLRLELRAMGI